MDEMGVGETDRVRAVLAASSGQLCSGIGTMVGYSVVEQIVAALARGESDLAVAREYGLDWKTVRA